MEIGCKLLPEFLQSPVMRGSILLILDFHGYDGLGERSSLPLLGHAGGQQVRRQWRVESVGQEDKLELHLWMTRDIKQDDNNSLDLYIIFQGIQCVFIE